MLCRVYEGPSARGVRDWLQLNGVEAFYRPDGPQQDGRYALASVWVVSGDEDRARSLLVFDAGYLVSDQPDACPRCGRPANHCWCASEAA